MMKQILVFLTTSVVISSSLAFAPASLASTKKVHSSSSLYFGIPTFGGGDKNDEEPEIEGLEKKQIGASGFLQLLTAGLGAPFLGDYQGVDKESGKFMFSLEANNLVDENGESKQTQMPYFESGWVDEEDLKKENEKKAKGGGFKFW